MNLNKLNDAVRQVLLNKQPLEEETLTEAKKLTAAAIVKMFKNADEWGDDMKHQVRNVKGNLEFVDSYWAGSDDALKRLITSWTSPNGTYAKFFREEYGATFKLVDKFTLMQATGRYKKVSDNGIVGVVLSIQGGTIKESEELEEGIKLTNSHTGFLGTSKSNKQDYKKNLARVTKAIYDTGSLDSGADIVKYLDSPSGRHLADFLSHDPEDAKLKKYLAKDIKKWKKTMSEDVELEEEALNEAFARLPGKVINNELVSVGKDLQAFISAQRNGDDVNEKQLAGIIKSLQGVKNQVKKFKSAEEVPASF